MITKFFWLDFGNGHVTLIGNRSQVQPALVSGS